MTIDPYASCLTNTYGTGLGLATTESDDEIGFEPRIVTDDGDSANSLASLPSSSHDTLGTRLHQQVQALVPVDVAAEEATDALLKTTAPNHQLGLPDKLVSRNQDVAGVKTHEIVSFDPLHGKRPWDRRRVGVESIDRKTA